VTEARAVRLVNTEFYRTNRGYDVCVANEQGAISWISVPAETFDNGDEPPKFPKIGEYFTLKFGWERVR
jgi:hypothetical protein